MCDSTVPSTSQWILSASKMLFKEGYHSISLVLKVPQLTTQQNPTQVVPWRAQILLQDVSYSHLFSLLGLLCLASLLCLRKKMLSSLPRIHSWPLAMTSIF